MEGGEALVISLTGQPFDVDFHPSADIVAAGLITGSIELFTYSDAESKRLWKSKKAHTESCRAIRFINGGQYILSGSLDRTIVATDVATGKVATRLQNAHSAAINRLEALAEHSVASGDDDGTVKVWDTRQKDCCATFSAHEDFIADMEFAAASQHLLAASGDGRLSICNLRRNKLEAVSENAEDELLSVTLVKNKQKVVCGTQGGVLLLYSWGHLEDCSDRFPGHPSSVDAIVKVDESTLLTGSSDGLIRVVSILPNKMLGVVGEHMDYPIEQLAFSRDRKILASASHDKTIKLWNVGYLSEGGDDDGDLQDAEVLEHLGGSTEENRESLEAAPAEAHLATHEELNNGASREEPSARRQGKRVKGKASKKDNGGNAGFFSDL